MVTRKDSEKISNLETDVKVIMEKVNTIENNHLALMKKDIDSLNNKIWGIVTLAIVQLCAIVLTTI